MYRRKWFQQKIKKLEQVLVWGVVLLVAVLTAVSSKTSGTKLKPTTTGYTVFNVYPETEKAGMEAMGYINQLRQHHGRQRLAFDPRVFTLAMARAKDMWEHKYYDHVNPKTGTCPYTMKGAYGLQNAEFVAENINGYQEYEEGLLTVKNLRPITEPVEAWMGSRGHRFNLLYEGHTAGAVACYKDKCVFLGLNNQRFGEGCHTAKEGKQHWQTAPHQPGEV